MIYHTRDFGNRHIIIWPILVMSREIQAYRSGTNVPRVIIFCEEKSKGRFFWFVEGWGALYI